VTFSTERVERELMRERDARLRVTDTSFPHHQELLQCGRTLPTSSEVGPANRVEFVR
jgi:hypothetical protein